MTSIVVRDLSHRFKLLLTYLLLTKFKFTSILGLYVRFLGNMGDREMYNLIVMILPTVLAVLCLAVFSEKTRWFCYSLVVLSMVSELVPQAINPVALAATCSVFVTLLVFDALHRMKQPKHAVLQHHQH